MEIGRDVEINLSDIDPSEGITDMRDLFPAPGETIEAFVKRLNDKHDE